MPGTMFQEVVSPRAGTRGSWYTLPLSFLAHTTVIVILVVVPLIATDVLLPTPRTALEYITNNFTPIVPAQPPPAPRSELVPSTAPHVGPVAPVVAPDGIGVESALIFDPETIATGNIDTVVGGLGAAQNVVEAPPLVTSQPAAPVRLGGMIQPPARTRYVAPEYPEIARQSRIKGTVIIEAVIGTNGKVENVRVLRSVPLLDGAALAAVRAWEYTPTLLNGVATPVIMTVTVRFDLN
jgi:periplasmic protein TonB